MLAPEEVTVSVLAPEEVTVLLLAPEEVTVLLLVPEVATNSLLAESTGHEGREVDDVAESPPEAAAVGPRGDQAPVGGDDGVSPSFKRPLETERINSFRD